MVPRTRPSEPRAGNPPASSTLSGICKHSSVQVSCPGLTGQSSLKEDVVSGTNFIVVRENCGGAYFGAKEEQRDTGSDLWIYRDQRLSAAHVSRLHSQAILVEREIGLLRVVQQWFGMSTRRMF